MARLFPGKPRRFQGKPRLFPGKPRRFQGGKLVLATHNPGKVREISQLLAPFGADVVSAQALSLPEPEETGDTFLANARIKAQSAAEISRFPALADDSGLSVEALDGAPGIHSARWAGPHKDFLAAMDKVADKLQSKENKRARFVCALVLCWPDGHEEAVEGTVHGTISWPPRGRKGFGYDPIFVPDGYTSTFAEMDGLEKQTLSHRADAFRKLVALCFAD